MKSNVFNIWYKCYSVGALLAVTAEVAGCVLLYAVTASSAPTELELLETRLGDFSTNKWGPIGHDSESPITLVPDTKKLPLFARAFSGSTYTCQTGH